MADNRLRMHNEGSDWSTREYWLARADKVRAIASEISDLQLQKRLLNIASKYEGCQTGPG
jgi:hypothetical protein